MTTASTAGQRDREWFESLFREHHAAILAYALRRVAAEADDVVAEVFTVAWRRRDAVPDDPLPWLYRTAAHHVLHAHRSTARRGGLVRQLTGRAAGAPPHDSVADDVAARLDGSASALRLLALLPAPDAEVLRLWAWEGLDAAGIGYVLGCTAATARVRLLRARRRARALLPATGAAGTAPGTASDHTAGAAGTAPVTASDHTASAPTVPEGAR